MSRLAELDPLAAALDEWTPRTWSAPGIIEAYSDREMVRRCIVRDRRQHERPNDDAHVVAFELEGMMRIIARMLSWRGAAWPR